MLSHNLKVCFSSNSVEWGTPQKLFDKLNEEFHFTLDACASDYNHKLDKYFTKEDNALIQNWKDNVVFCNPPYGKNITGEFVKKCYFENLVHNITIVMLLPVRTDTKWFHNFIYDHCEIRFCKGRLKFNDGVNSAPFPSMICIYHKK